MINLEPKYRNVASFRTELKELMKSGEPVIITLYGKPHSVLLKIEAWKDFMDYLSRKRKPKTPPASSA